ncbi:hypothetical protein VNO77_30608 [Canavalia gladiata]|uniref:Uncharacterized protein n=1 Tax=Canavalia gladiata TaxID=3824 RepID=A0AAN9KS04_CANGL
MNQSCNAGGEGCHQPERNQVWISLIPEDAEKSPLTGSWKILMSYFFHFGFSPWPRGCRCLQFFKVTKGRRGLFFQPRIPPKMKRKDAKVSYLVKAIYVRNYDNVKESGGHYLLQKKKPPLHVLQEVPGSLVLEGRPWSCPYSHHVAEPVHAWDKSETDGGPVYPWRTRISRAEILISVSFPSPQGSSPLDPTKFFNWTATSSNAYYLPELQAYPMSFRTRIAAMIRKISTSLVETKDLMVLIPKRSDPFLVQILYAVCFRGPVLESVASINLDFVNKLRRLPEA